VIANRLTVAQALVRSLAAQWTEIRAKRERLFGGVWAIFGAKRRPVRPSWPRKR
jgi:TPP-dependent trihydroxycyclohexane-1,2-dione (THcHDO) dehydratase